MANFFLHRFPFCPQHDSMQCGAACLQMLCLHYGRRYTLDYLSNACAATSEGVSLYGLKFVAEQLGFRTQCVKTTVEQLSRTTAPCVLHWNQNHFVILYKNKGGGNSMSQTQPKVCWLMTERISWLAGWKAASRTDREERASP